MSNLRGYLPLLAIVVGCADVAQPFELDHPRVIAVATEPAGLAPGAAAELRVLVTGAAGPHEVAADAMAVAVPAPLAGAMTVERHEDVWTLGAPPADQIAALRAALQLRPEQPLALPIEVRTEVDGVPLTAQKWVIVDGAAANPMISGLTVDGAAVETITAQVGTRPTLAIAHDAGTALVRWLSSVGDLERYQTPAAILDASAAATGAIVVVVRDQRGGVAWQIVPARVE